MVGEPRRPRPGVAASVPLAVKPLPFDHPSFALDRVTLAELVRLFVGRAEDISLLQIIRPSLSELSAQSRARVTVECTYREEWRAGREDELFSALKSSNVFNSTPSSGSDGPASPLSLRNAGFPGHKSHPCHAYLQALFRSNLMEMTGSLESSDDVKTNKGHCVMEAFDMMCGGLDALEGTGLLEGLAGRSRSQRAQFRDALAAVEIAVSDAEASMRVRHSTDIQLRIQTVLGKLPARADAPASAAPASPSTLSSGSASVHGSPASPVKPAVNADDVSRVLTIGLRAAAQASQRYDAAVVVQAAIRGMLAKFFVRRLRVQRKLPQILKSIMALKIQRFVRRAQALRRWRAKAKVQTARHRRDCSAAVALWQSRVTAWRTEREVLLSAMPGSHPNGRPSFTPSGYFCGHVKVPSPSHLRPHQSSLPAPVVALLWFDAALVLQSFFRAVSARLQLCRMRVAIRSIQRCARGYLARRQARSARVQVYSVAPRRRMHKTVQRFRRFQVFARPLLHDIVHTSVFIDEEVAEIEAEISKEISMFERSWADHESKLTSAVLKGKLNDGWVVQDLPGEETKYLNLKTGKLHSEHPNLRKAQVMCKQHRADALVPFRARLQVALDYKEELLCKRRDRLAVELSRLEAVRLSLRTKPVGFTDIFESLD